MTLAALQAAFQAGVLDGSSAILAAIEPSRTLSREARFGIYAEAYLSRLAEFVAHDYPVLNYVLGDEAFFALADAYIEATPSRHRNARHYAQGIPDFLGAHAPWRETRALAELACFEQALGDAFDAADTGIANLEMLTAFSDEDQPRLCFSFAPGLRLLALPRGLVACYEAAVEQRAVPLPEANDKEAVVVWRAPSLDPYYRLLEEDEALALDAALQGGSLAEICSLLGLRNGGEAAALAAHHLSRWFGDGLVSGMSPR